MKELITIEKIRKDVYCLKKIIIYTISACAAIWAYFYVQSVFLKVLSVLTTIYFLKKITYRTVATKLIDENEFYFEEGYVDDEEAFLLFVGEQNFYFYLKEYFLLEPALKERIRKIQYTEK